MATYAPPPSTPSPCSWRWPATCPRAMRGGRRGSGGGRSWGGGGEEGGEEGALEAGGGGAPGKDAAGGGTGQGRPPRGADGLRPGDEGAGVRSVRFPGRGGGVG